MLSVRPLGNRAVSPPREILTTGLALGDSAERVVLENGLAGAALSCEILGRPAPNFSHRGLYGAYKGWYLNVSHPDDFLLAHLVPRQATFALSLNGTAGTVIEPLRATYG